MNMNDWAKQEIEIACKCEQEDDSAIMCDYTRACCESAYKAFQSLLEDEHSGMSIGFTKNILNRLIDGKPLTAIKDTPEVWAEANYYGKVEGVESFRCTRMSSLTKDVYPDGRVDYCDTNYYYCVNRDDPEAPTWHNGFISRIIHEKYPITMPYYPTKPYVVYCTEGLFDPKNGDFDTIGVWYVQKPDGEKDVIERFFKEAPRDSDEQWIEINKQEYLERVGESKLDFYNKHVF